MNLTSATHIHTLEDRSFRAWPALESRYYDGWLLRFADGYTRRSNSVNPIYEGDNLDLEAKIGYCEAMYAERNLPTIYKMTSAVIPPQLDALLGKHDYNKRPGALVQTLDVTTAPDSVFIVPDALHIDQYDILNDVWLHAFVELNQVATEHVPTMQRTLNHILPQRCFMRLYDGDETLALGLAVCDEGYLGLYDIVTSEDHRRQGHGLALVQAMLAWGKTNDATLAYLQVTPENAPAQALYGKLGFETAYEYWYRIKRNTATS